MGCPRTLHLPISRVITNLVLIARLMRQLALPMNGPAQLANVARAVYDILRQLFRIGGSGSTRRLSLARGLNLTRCVLT